MNNKLAIEKICNYINESKQCIDFFEYLLAPQNELPQSIRPYEEILDCYKEAYIKKQLESNTDLNEIEIRTYLLSIKGLTIKEIATLLERSEPTIKSYRTKICYTFNTKPFRQACYKYVFPTILVLLKSNESLKIEEYNNMLLNPVSYLTIFNKNNLIGEIDTNCFSTSLIIKNALFKKKLNAYTKLSPIEKEIYYLYNIGEPLEFISEKLYRSVSTINKYRHIIKRKLGIDENDRYLFRYLLPTCIIQTD